MDDLTQLGWPVAGIVGALALGRAIVQGRAQQAVAREEGAAAVVPELRAELAAMRSERAEQRAEMERQRVRIDALSDGLDACEERHRAAEVLAAEAERRAGAAEEAVAELQEIVARLTGAAPRRRITTPPATRYVEPEAIDLGPVVSSPPPHICSDRKDLDPL